MSAVQAEWQNKLINCSISGGRVIIQSVLTEWSRRKWCCNYSAAFQKCGPLALEDTMHELFLCVCVFQTSVWEIVCHRNSWWDEEAADEVSGEKIRLIKRRAGRQAINFKHSYLKLFVSVSTVSTFAATAAEHIVSLRAPSSKNSMSRLEFMFQVFGLGKKN